MPSSTSPNRCKPARPESGGPSPHSRCLCCGLAVAVGLALATWLLTAPPAVLAGGTAPASKSKSSAEAAAFDLDGRPVNPFGATNSSATVLLFLGHECPISNRYAPELRRLHDKFAPRGVRFWLVYP